MKTFIKAKPSRYSEIYQDSDIKFAFAVETEDTIIQVHDFVKCRDFLNEAVVSTQIGCDCPTIYSFKYPTEKYPVDLETTRLILSGSSFNLFSKNIHLLQDVDHTLKIEEIPDTELLYVTAGSMWTLSTVMISLYTHILRCLYQYEIEADDLWNFLEQVAKLNGNAAKYQQKINQIDLKKLVLKSEVIFPKGTLPIPEMSSLTKVHTIHNYGGIVTWSGCISSNKNDLYGMYEKSVDIYRNI